ncbi:hypothetical protein B0T17DRAFT_586461 [Bombardia bombarda]|uniref:BTB domain-containing protein n=1 Tax=Bombardia bombarda TaxID=252184 RepID=A0AA39XJG0_9PEZI|nr:hypothetical protein B0T17DRAFT_586461 [Bombardia bombarda]
MADRSVAPSPAPSRRTPARQTAPAVESGELFIGRVVNVYVGPERKTFSVHEKLLSTRSEYFDHHFNGTNEQDGQDVLELLDEDPKLFSLLINWIYGTTFATSGGTRVFRYPLPHARDNLNTVRDYIGLYILGGKFNIIGVRNAAIDVLYNYFGEQTEEVRCPNLEDVRYLFDHTAPDEQIRRLVIAHTLFHLFGKKRERIGLHTLPREWEAVISSNGEIAWSMIRMLADWRWVCGVNVPDMKIKPRQEFHERIPQPPFTYIKGEEDEFET